MCAVECSIQIVMMYRTPQLWMWYTVMVLFVLCAIQLQPLFQLAAKVADEAEAIKLLEQVGLTAETALLPEAQQQPTATGFYLPAFLGVLLTLNRTQAPRHLALVPQSGCVCSFFVIMILSFFFPVNATCC